MGGGPGLVNYGGLRSNTAIIKISPSIPVKVAATISCAHSTVSGALRVAGNISGRKVIVFGAGMLGLSCVSMCKEAGAASIGLVDHDANRLRWGKKFGSDNEYLLNKENNSIVWPEADLVFDMTGNPQAMKMGIDSLAVGGHAIWIGAVFPDNPVPVDAQKIVRKLLQIRGLHNYNYEDFLNATLFIENNYRKYPFEDLIETEYTMDKIEEAFLFARDKKPVRVGIKVNE